MKKIEFFRQVMSLVSSKTDISEEQMLSMERTAEVLDARALVVYFCKRYGISNNEVRRLFGRNGHHFAQRMYDMCDARRRSSRYFSAIFVAIGKQLGIIE